MLLVQAALRAGIYPTCTGNTAEETLDNVEVLNALETAVQVNWHFHELLVTPIVEKAC